MQKKKFLLIIRADTNDADYIDRRTEWEEGYEYAPDLEKLRKIAEVLKNNSGNWGVGEVRDKYNDPFIIYKDLLTEEEINWFNQMIPYGEYGMHTIENINLYEIKNKEEIF